MSWAAAFLPVENWRPPLYCTQSVSCVFPRRCRPLNNNSHYADVLHCIRSLNWLCHKDKSFSWNRLRMQKGKMDGWLTKRRQKIKSVHSALRSAGSNISRLCRDQCVRLAFCGFCIRVAEWWFSSDTLEASRSHFVLVFTRCTNLQHLAVNLRDMFDFLLIFYTFSSAICLYSTSAEATDPFLFPPATGGRNPRGN